MGHLIEYKFRENEKKAKDVFNFSEQLLSRLEEKMKKFELKMDNRSNLLGKQPINLEDIEGSDYFSIGKHKDVDHNWDIFEVLNQFRQFYVMATVLKYLLSSDENAIITSLSPSQQSGPDIEGVYLNKSFAVEIYGGLNPDNRSKFRDDCFKLLKKNKSIENYYACFMDVIIKNGDEPFSKIEDGVSFKWVYELTGLVPLKEGDPKIAFKKIMLHESF
jgi:hypothetical protein